MTEIHIGNGHISTGLKPSIPDTVTLSKALEKRFATLREDHLRMRGVSLRVPEELKSDMLLWLCMLKRHKRKDYRNSDAELKATREVCQWTVSVNHRLRGQIGNPPKVQWRD